MFVYGQTTADAIAVMSFLACEPTRRVDSGEIAAARNISRALAAKLLTRMAAAQLVVGQRGPGGGYMLAKSPQEISLMDIASLFEQVEPPTVCAFGHDWCGKGDPCPLHDLVHRLLESNRQFMTETKLSIFLQQKEMANQLKLNQWARPAAP